MERPLILFKISASAPELSNYYESLLRSLPENQIFLDLPIIYEILECFDNKLRPNNHILLHYLKQTYVFGILELLFLETPACCDRYSVLKNMFVGLYIYHICITFLRGLARHIENKNQSARSNFAALKNCIMLNVSF